MMYEYICIFLRGLMVWLFGIFGDLLMALLASLIFYLVVNWYPEQKRKRKVAPHIKWLVGQILQTGQDLLKELGGSIDDSDEEFKDKFKNFHSLVPWDIKLSGALSVFLNSSVIDYRDYSSFIKKSCSDYKDVFSGDKKGDEIVKMNVKLCFDFIKELLFYYESLDDYLIVLVNELRSDFYLQKLNFFLYHNIKDQDFFMHFMCKYKNLLKKLKEYEVELDNRGRQEQKSLSGNLIGCLDILRNYFHKRFK